MLRGTCSKRLRSPSRGKPSNFLHCRFLHAKVPCLVQSLASAKWAVRSAPRPRLQSSAPRKRLQTATKAGNILYCRVSHAHLDLLWPYARLRGRGSKRPQSLPQDKPGKHYPLPFFACLRSLPASANLQSDYIEINRSHMPNNHRNIQMPRPPCQPDGGMLLICNWITQSSP